MTFELLGGRTVLGIDPSTKRLAWAMVERNQPIRMGVIQLGKKNDTYTVRKPALAQRLLADTFPDPHGWYVFLEEPLVGRGGVRSTLTQAYVNGAVQAYFTSRGAHLAHAHPSTWKSKVIGGTSKAAVAEAVGLRWADAAEQAQGDQDVLDSIGIALYGALVVGNRPVVDG